jgi:purine-nucleoside phosphorylase
MSEPYSKKLNSQIKNIAIQNNIDLKEGVYAGVLGPQLETRAEYRMLQILEVDTVGMSTVSEVIVAKSINLPCVAISVLTDECDPLNLHQVDIKDIIAIAEKAEPKLILLFKELIKQL